jgi:hypothetical protein
VVVLLEQMAAVVLAGLVPWGLLGQAGKAVVAAEEE